MEPLRVASRLLAWLPFQRLGLRRLKFGWLEAGVLAVMALALAMRLWELGGRTMHYDEAIHLHFSWRLLHSGGTFLGWPWAFGTDYIHSPWMHGPFQIEFTAFIFRVFGDNDFTARLGYVLFGAALVGLPYFLRDYLGRAGVFLAAVMLALSPSLLYFSRFGRNDIIMAFWATALLVLIWRYLHGGKRRDLYLASAVLAFMFATKETAYLVTAVFGALVFLLALPDLVPWALGRVNLAWKGMPAGFFLLLVTLTLPQWAPIAGLAQGALGLTLANPDPQSGQNVPYADGTEGLVGAPAWAGSTLLLPIYDFPWGLHLAAVAVGLAVLLWMLRRGGWDARRAACLVLVPLLATATVGMVLFRPFWGVFPVGAAPLVDLVLAAVFASAAVVVVTGYRYPWRRAALLIGVPALLGLVYSVLFTPVVNLQAVVDAILPTGVTLGAASNGIPANYVVALLLLVGALIVSVVLGVRWLGGQWLVCAGIFYVIWAALYTTLFTNLAGLFSGSWQGVGYWIAQQDVARGNQPWYYYFVGLSVYELLPVAFGIAGAVYFLRRGDALGLALSFWALATFIAYTLASEKMPWLLVNITLPFILLSAKFLGESAERVRWRQALRQGAAALIVFAPLAAIGGVYVLFNFVGPEAGMTAEYWALLASTALLTAVSAYLIRTAGPGRGAPIAGLGLAALLLGFGAWGAVRAAYTFDESNKEILVYAQGGADLEDTYEVLANQVFPSQAPGQSVRWDYDIWYPFQWYVRDHDRRGELRFGCFKREGEEGWNDSCDALEKDAETDTAEEGPDAAEEGPDAEISAMVLTSVHSERDDNDLDAFRKEGPYTGLLWFPETYRRPSENRQEESFTKELSQDFPFFQMQATSKKAWRSALDYALFRNLEQDWFSTEYYSYLSETEPPETEPSGSDPP